MPEQDVIARTTGPPATVRSLALDLRRLGLEDGAVVIAHTSLSALGWVVGGPVAVVRALETVLGERGTLVMPTQSVGLSDPATWENPTVPEDWWETIRQAMPPYDPSLTPALGVGMVPEMFRKQAGTTRSAHPLYSFAARGPDAERVTEHHDLSYGLGEGSPLSRLYDLHARVLLLGVDHAANTSLHLCEYRLPSPWRRGRDLRMPTGSGEDGRTRWAAFPDLHLDESDFASLGADFSRDGGWEASGPVGGGRARLVRQRDIVDYGVAWMRRHRQPITRREDGRR